MKSFISNPLTKGFVPFLFLAAVLAGCAGFKGAVQPLHAPVVVESEDTVVKAYRLAHEAVDEANAALTAVNKVIGNNVENGIWTKSQAQSYLNKSKKYGKDVDRAREAMRFGNLADAAVQADAVKKLIVLLQAEVAKQARKES